MDTSDTWIFEEQEGEKRPWRRLLPLVGALVVGFLLVSAWFSTLAASKSDSEGSTLDRPLQQTYELSIFKNNIPPIFIIGTYEQTNNRYLISVVRNSGDVPPALSVRDKLPAGMRVNSIEATNWSCSILAARTEVFCAYALGGAVPPTGVAYPAIFINLDVSSSIAHTVFNTATMFITDTNTVYKSVSIQSTIDSVDLELKKSVNPLYADVGEPLKYTYVLKNRGPATAVGVVVSDTLPLGVAYGTGTAEPPLKLASFNKTTLTNNIIATWLLNPILANETVTLTLPATPTASAAGKKLTNTAVVTSTNLSDWDPSDNKSTAFFYVSGLEISKHIGVGATGIVSTTKFVGEPINLTIRVDNNGTTSASSVRVTDVFTPALSIIAYRVNGGSRVTTSGSSISPFIGTMAPASSATISVTVRGNATVPITKTVTNTATVSASPGIVRESNVVTMTLKPAADLRVTKVDTPSASTVLAGQSISYTISVQNIGSISATHVLITDVLSSNLTYLSIDKGSLAMTHTYTSTNKLVHTWWLSNTLLPGGPAVSFKIGARVSSSANTGDSVVNTVTASTKSFEAYLGNNTASDINTVSTPPPPPNVRFNVSVKPSVAEPGEGFLFTIIADNVGSTTLNNAQIVDIFPSVLDIVDAATTRGTLTTNASTRTVTVSLGNFAPGQTAQVTISTRVNSSATSTATYTHASELTYNPTITSNTVRFHIVVDVTLPGTGIHPPGDGIPIQINPAPVFALALLLLTLLAALGAAWNRERSV